MKSIGILIIMAGLTQFLHAQDTTGIKTVKKYEGSKLRLIQNYDLKGNCYFEKNDGLFGKVIMIWGTDFDSINREKRVIFAHCNVGFSIREIEYEPHKIKTFYRLRKVKTEDTIESTDHPTYPFHPYEYIDTIKSILELEGLVPVKERLNGERNLSNVVNLDENNKFINRISFNENGDTSSIELWRNGFWYIEKYFDEGEEKNKKKITDEFDLRGNLTKRIMVQTNGITEDYTYKYSNTNKLIEEVRLINNEFDFKVINRYNTTDQKVEELYYERDPDKIERFKKYEYNQKGKEVKETCYDYREDELNPIYVYETTYEYW